MTKVRRWIFFVLLVGFFVDSASLPLPPLPRKMTHPTGWHTFGEMAISFVSVTVYTLFHQHDYSGKWLRVLFGFSGK
jgi:hypothetical protein